MLRDYQEKIVGDTRELIRAGCKRILIESPTGSGKTRTASFMLKGAHERGWRAWFVVHRVELVDQTAATFQEQGIPFGLIASGHPLTDHKIQIVSIDTAKGRLGEIVLPEFVKYDECHHIAAAKWDTVYNACVSADAISLGYTATPIRKDGKPLGKYFDAMVHGPTIPWLISEGHLSGFRYYAPSVPDLSAVGTRAGDFSADQLETIMRGQAIVGEIVGTWQRLAQGLLTIGFAPTVKASLAYVEAFQAAGIRAMHLDGTTPRTVRRAAALAFARREIDVLWNVDLFGEGFDLGALAGVETSIEAVIQARATHSLGLHKQQIGRGLRKKDIPAILLDHAGNWMRHGMPDDVIEWSLDKRPLRVGNGGTSVAITRCMACYTIFRPTSDACPTCGTRRPKQERDMHYMPGELEEIKRTEKQKAALEAERVSRQKKRELKEARTYPQLIAFAEKWGYENPKGWAGRWMELRNKHRSKR